jgi:hypothetical protein
VRPSKDLDLYVLPQQKDRLIGVLLDLGLQDYYDKSPYDRSWIFRSTKNDEIVDVIWTMANHRTEVDQNWIRCGPEVEFGGERIKLIPVEELIWSKLYVLQRDRSDWPDVINLIDRSLHTIDWHRLFDRLGEDAPLLASVLGVYGWLRPEQIEHLPEWLRAKVYAPFKPADPNLTKRRAALIDSRPWLLATQHNGDSPKC